MFGFAECGPDASGGLDEQAHPTRNVAFSSCCSVVGAGAIAAPVVFSYILAPLFCRPACRSCCIPGTVGAACPEHRVCTCLLSVASSTPRIRLFCSLPLFNTFILLTCSFQNQMFSDIRQFVQMEYLPLDCDPGLPVGSSGDMWGSTLRFCSL